MVINFVVNERLVQGHESTLVVIVPAKLAHRWRYCVQSEDGDMILVLLHTKQRSFHQTFLDVSKQCRLSDPDRPKNKNEHGSCWLAQGIPYCLVCLIQERMGDSVRVEVVEPLWAGRTIRTESSASRLSGLLLPLPVFSIFFETFQVIVVLTLCLAICHQRTT